jgi:hypothetical protein
LLEHEQHLAALEVVCTAREEDSVEVESAYLEGWAWYLRAQALEAGAGAGPASGAGDKGKGKEEEREEDNDDDADADDPEKMTAQECLAESMRALIECAAVFSEQEYPDEGIGGHVAELLDELRGRGVVPNIVEEGEGEGEGGGWEDVDMK